MRPIWSRSVSSNEIVIVRNAPYTFELNHRNDLEESMESTILSDMHSESRRIFEQMEVHFRPKSDEVGTMISTKIEQEIVNSINFAVNPMNKIDKVSPTDRTEEFRAFQPIELVEENNK